MFNHICHTYFIFVLFICFLNQLLKNVIYRQFCFSVVEKSHTVFQEASKPHMHTHTIFIYLFISLRVA